MVKVACEPETGPHVECGIPRRELFQHPEAALRRARWHCVGLVHRVICRGGREVAAALGTHYLSSLVCTRRERLRHVPEARKSGDGLVQILGDAFEGPSVVTQQAGNRAGLEEVRIVFASKAPALIPENQEDVEVIQSTLRLRRNHGQLDSSELERLHRISLANEVGSEQSMVTGIIIWAEIFQQLLKSNVLVGDGLRPDLLHSSNQLRDGRISR